MKLCCMILRTCVVIPCFDQPRTISSVLKEIVVRTSYPILVIDDGSETPVTNVLYSFEVKQALEQGRLRVIRFDKRQGKGAALRFAIQDLMPRGYTHMLTMDGDGRQLASELGKLTEAGRQYPWDVILGQRQIKTEPPGWFRRIGRALLNHSVRAGTGTKLMDARTGFRLYPLFPLQMMRFKTRGYEWEIEVLVRLLWNGARVREIPVETQTYDPTEHAVHFHRLWDGLRLFTLNLILIGVSMLRSNARPAQLALSAAVGVFIGCSPLIGLHTVIAAVVALLFPLNLIVVLAGTHVSVAPLFPMIMLSEVYIGKHWLNIASGPGLMGHMHQWLAGSVVLGALLAIPAAVVTYLLARAVQNPEVEMSLHSAQDGRHPLLDALVRKMGLPAAVSLMPLIAVWRYLTLFRARRGLSEYYRVTMPGLPLWQRHARIVRHLWVCGRIQAEAMALARGRHSGIITRSDGNLAVSLRSGYPPLVITARLGCWEAAGSSLRPLPRVVYADRPSGNQFELVPFMGRLAAFDVTPFWQAMRNQTPVSFSFGVRTGDGPVYELFSREPQPVQLQPGVAEEIQILEWASRFARQLEFYVRRYPEQWFNFYPFWSAIPPHYDGQPGLYMEELQAVATLKPRSSINKNGSPLAP